MLVLQEPHVLDDNKAQQAYDAARRVFEPPVFALELMGIDDSVRPTFDTAGNDAQADDVIGQTRNQRHGTPKDSAPDSALEQGVYEETVQLPTPTPEHRTQGRQPAYSYADLPGAFPPDIPLPPTPPPNESPEPVQGVEDHQSDDIEVDQAQ